MRTKIICLVSLLVVSSVIVVWLGIGNNEKPQEVKAQATLNFYVATNGSDATGDGALGNPFATLEKARDVIRAQRGVSATVWIRGGTYQLTQSFTLTNQDSGTAQAPITYQNYNNEEVHIIGGKKLTPANWKIIQPGAIRDRLRSPAQGAVYQIDLKNDESITDFGSLETRAMQLFFDGKPMTLARYPNINALPAIRIGDSLTRFDISNQGGNRWRYMWDGYGTNPNINSASMPISTTVLVNGNGTAPSPWSIYNRGSFVVVGVGDNYFEVINPNGVAEIDKFLSTGYIQINTSWLLTKGPSGSAHTYYDDTDIPGTWVNTDDAYAYGFWGREWNASHLKFANITTDVNGYRLNFATAPPNSYGITGGMRFYFYNIPEELDSPGEYWIDRTTGILYFWPPANVTSRDSYVSLLEAPLITVNNANYITFRGLIFENTRGQALLASGCDHLVVDDCVIRNIGAKKNALGQWPSSPWLYYALAIKVSTNCGVINSEVYNTGDGGIFLHGGNRITETPSHNYAKNNTIYNIGQWNMINCPALTINGLVGGGSNECGIGDMVSHNLIHDVPGLGIYMGGDQHIIEFNEIYNTCLQTSDLGAVYAGANITEHDNIIRYNYIHDIYDKLAQGVYGVYLDSAESGFKVYGNVFNDIDTPFLANDGSNHTLANNVFINSVKNDALFNAPSLPAPPPTGNKVLANIHYAPVTKTPFIRVENEPDLVKINNWTKGDPSFINYGNKNFQLTADSPAWRLGFQRIPIEEIGPNSTVVGQDMNFDNLPNPADPVKTLKSNFQNGLKLYLPLGEGYGQDLAFDQSGNNNNGTLLGGVLWLGPNLGKLGNGMAIDGAAGSYVKVASSPSLTTQSARTVSFWMKTTSNNGIITTFGGSNSTYGAFYLPNSSNPLLFLNDGDFKYWDNVVSYLDGNWHHWCLTIPATGAGSTISQYDIASATLKIDNTEIKVRPGNSVLTNQPIYPWTEHRFGGSYFSINASMDEIMIWNRVLTNVEITDLYNLNIFESGAPTTGPNIILTKSVNKTQASSGEEITYIIAYQNTGTANAAEVVITDAIPTGATYIAGSASNGGTLSGATLIWNIGAVATIANGSVSFRVRVD